MQGDATLVVGDLSLFGAVEFQTLTLGALAELGDVVEPEHHVLRRHGDRRAVGGVEDIVRSEHQHLSLEDSLVAQGKMHGHLVAVEVGIECRTCQRVELDGLALDHLGLEGLDAEAVQCRGAVEQHGVSLHHILQDVPYHRLLAVHDLLGALHGLHDAALHELADHERLVELGCHVFGQTALVHLQLRAYDDNRTGRVVDTLTEKVLTEAALLAFERVGEALEGAVGIGLHGRRLARVVEQRVYSFLQHALLVAEDHLRSLDLDEAFQTVVADDHTTVEVVEVGGGEAAAVQGHQRAQIGRDHRHSLQDHPLGLVALGRRAEALHYLQALQSLGLALLRAVGVGLMAQVVAQLVEVQILQKVVDGLGAHLGDEFIGVVVGQIAILLGQTVHEVEILFLAQQIHLRELLAEGARIDDDIALIVDHGLELLGGKAQQVTDLVGKRAEVPDVSHRHYQLDVTHALAAHFLLSHFHAASVAHDTLVADALVLSAVALIVLDRAEDALAEKAVALGFVSAVVDGLGLEDLTRRLLEDLLGRCKPDGNLGERGL